MGTQNGGMTLMRKPGPGASAIYEMAQQWAQRCLRQPGSLFADQPGPKVSTAQTAAALHAAFVDNPMLGHDTFLDKLRVQLADEPVEGGFWRTSQHPSVEGLLWVVVVRGRNTPSGRRSRG